MNKINLSDGYLYYDEGRIDKWCVYKVDSQGNKNAPMDVEYFTKLQQYSKLFGSNQLYSDIITIYDLTSNYFDNEVVEKIKIISLKYEEHQDDIYEIFSTIYMGMISEENKKNTKLGKRIKRLGLYYLLVKGKEPEYSANFMKNMNWKQIDNLCKEGNF